MMQSSVICCDASLAIRLLTAPEGAGVSARWENWKDNRATFVAPLLFKYEVANALHRMSVAGPLSLDDALSHFDALMALPIRFETAEQVHRDAMQIASELGLPAVYDAHYVAVAMMHDADFWTFDQRLFQSVKHAFDRIYLET